MDKNRWKVIAIAELAIIAVVVIFLIGFFAGRGKSNVQTNASVSESNNPNENVAQNTESTTDSKTEETSPQAATSQDNSSSDSGMGTEGFEVVVKSGLNVSTKQSAKWPDGSKECYQFDLTLENKTGEDIENWAVKIPVPEDTELRGGWCANIVLDGGYLYLSPVDEYSAKIPKDSKKADIGIQISSKEEPKMEGIIAGTKGESITKNSAEDGSNQETQSTSSNTTTGSAKKGEYYGKLSVKGNKLVNSKGEAVQLKGVSTHGLGWFPEYVNKESFEALQNLGANTIRLAMYTDEDAGYCTSGDKAKIKQTVKNGVEYATLLDMYVIIDWHILHDLTPQKYKTEAISFFDEMSKLYSSNEHVIYEICNEPNGGTSWEEIKQYAQEVIPVIRKNDPDAVILIGTPTWSQDVDQVIGNTVAGDNLMYVLHFYAATHKEGLRDKLTKALDAGIPVFISEFSICDASGNGGIDYDSAAKWMDVINKYQLSYVGWNLSNKNETSSILKPDCTKKNGYTMEDFSDTGKWLIESFQK